MSSLPARRSLLELSEGRVRRGALHEIVKADAYRAVITAHETAKVDAIGEVTEAAMMATSQISSIEALLVSRTPHAEARLRHLADAGTAGLATVVINLSRNI
jgi:hypothetical protein